jgi:carboxylesterase type B
MIHRAAHNTGLLYAYRWSYVPPGWRALSANSYHGIELVYTFAYPTSFVTHQIMGLTGLAYEQIGASGPTDVMTILASTGYWSTFPAVVSLESMGLTNDIMTAWTNFAKTSDPSFNNTSVLGFAVDWPAYTGEPAGGSGNGTYVEIRSDETTGYCFQVKTDGLEAAFGIGGETE